MATSETGLLPVDPDAVVRVYGFAASFLCWWHQAGRNFYGKAVIDPAYKARFHCEPDEGLQELANECVLALGGWRSARRLLGAAGRVYVRPALPARAIYLSRDTIKEDT